VEMRLAHLDVVNIGAAGTFVVRGRVTRARLRTEFARELPFETDIVICDGREILALLAKEPFAGQPQRPDIVWFVSVLARRPRRSPGLPRQLPPGGPWMLKIVARDDQFVLGTYRRHMKAIGHLGTLDTLFGVPVTTRNWNTITAIAKVLASGPRNGSSEPRAR
ncbi:MAG: hypothetical protein ACYC7F_13770, partial [Gemmatimonadaceae bacterium]